MKPAAEEELDDVPPAIRDEALGLAFTSDSLDKAKDASKFFKAARKQRLKGDLDKARELIEKGIDAAADSIKLQRKAVKRLKNAIRGAAAGDQK